MPQSGPLKLAILAGGDSPATYATVVALTQLPEAQVVGVVLDTGRISLKTRLHRMGRSIRREGWSYLAFRIGMALADHLERLAMHVASEDEVAALFARAFPGEALDLKRLCMQHKIAIHSVDSLNGSSAVEILRSLRVDLGIVLGTRISRRATFFVPRLGCLEMHLGKGPESRSTAPGFWELYDGESTARITLHLVDEGLDTGDVVATETVPVDRGDTPETLRRRLETRGRELLVRCVADFAQRRVAPRAQPTSRRSVRMPPTRRERNDLERRFQTSRGRQAPWVKTVKTAWYLLLYYAGAFHLVRALRRLRGGSRACVLVYHRVNDLGDDPLTTRVRGFVEHMVLLHKYYKVIPSAALVEQVVAGQSFPSNTVAIHFDDCYRDIFTHAKPVLTALKFPASVFVSSGFVGTKRQFPHDERSPWVFENLHKRDVCELATSGFEVGSHTVNHVDLAQCDDETVFAELLESKRDLEEVVGRPVTLFSLPFGQEANTRAGVEELVRKAGYRAMFSAYGGYVTCASHLFDLRRISVSGDARPIDLLMEIEGLSLGAFRRSWRARRLRQEPVQSVLGTADTNIAN